MFIDFRERNREGERERNINVKGKHPSAAPVHAWTGHRTHNLGMCPGRELNLQPFGAQDHNPTNRATWPRKPSFLFRSLLLQKLLLNFRWVQGTPPKHCLGWGGHMFQSAWGSTGPLLSWVLAPRAPFTLRSVLVWLLNYLIIPVLSPQPVHHSIIPATHSRVCA